MSGSSHPGPGAQKKEVGAAAHIAEQARSSEVSLHLIFGSEKGVGPVETMNRSRIGILETSGALPVPCGG